MSSPRNKAGISGSNSPAGVRDGTRVVLREITATLHNSPPIHAVHRKSVSNTPPAKAEHEVKVQFTREFADVVSSSSGPESLSSASSFQSLASTLSSKSSSGICVDSIPSTPQKAADTSYVNSEIPGLDDLILACGNIRLNADQPEVFPVSDNLNDSTLTVTACDSSFQLQENGQDLSQDQTFASATDELILNQSTDLLPVPTGDASQNVSPTLKSDNCDLDSTKDLSSVAKEPCENAALNQTRKLSSNLNAADVSPVLDQIRDSSNAKGSVDYFALNKTRYLSTNSSVGENSPVFNDACEILSTPTSSDDYLTLNETRELSINSNTEESPALNVTSVISSNTKVSHDYLTLNQTRNVSTNSNAGENSPALNRTIEISSNTKSHYDYIALNQTRNLSLLSDAENISPVLNEVREISSNAKCSDDYLVLNETRHLSTNSRAEDISPVQNEIREISSSAKSSDDYLGLNQTRNLSPLANAEVISPVLNEIKDVSSNANRFDDDLGLNHTRNLSPLSSAEDISPVLNKIREVSSNVKSSDDYLALNQTRNLSPLSKADDISPLQNKIREISSNAKSSDDYLVLNQTKNLSSLSNAEDISRVQNEIREIPSNAKPSDDNLALNQTKNLLTKSNVGDISPALNEAREILSIAKASDNTLALNQTRDLSTNSDAKEKSLVLNATTEISSNTKTSDDYVVSNPNRILSTNSNAEDNGPVGSDNRLVLNQTSDLITNSGSEINACVSRTEDSSLNLLSNKSATNLYQTNNLITNTDSVGRNTFLNEDSSLDSNPVIVESTSNKSEDVIDVKSSKRVLNGTLNLSKESVSAGSGIGSNATSEAPSIDAPTGSLEARNHFSVTEKSERISFDAHTEVVAQNEKEFIKENTSNILQAVLKRPLDDVSTATQEPVALVEAEVLKAAVTEASQKLTPEVLKNTVTQVSDEQTLHKIIQKVSCEINTKVSKEFVTQILKPEELAAEKVSSSVKSVEKDDISEQSESAAPQISTPEVSEVLKSVVLEDSKSEVSKDCTPAVSDVLKPEISDISKSQNPEIPDSKSEVLEVLKPEVPEVVKLKDPEVSKSETFKVSKTEAPEDWHSIVPEASKSKDPVIFNPITPEVFESGSKSELAFTKDAIEITGKGHKTLKHPQNTKSSVDTSESADRFNTVVSSAQQTSASRDTTPCIPITLAETTSNVPKQTLTELNIKATNEDPKNHLAKKQVAAHSEATSIHKEILPNNPLHIKQEVLQRSPDIQATPIVQQDLPEHSKAEGTKSQESPSYYPQTNVKILVHEPQHNLDQQQEGVTNNKVTENCGESVDDDLDRTVTLQDLSFHSPGSENGTELYAAFKPQQQSTTLGLDCNFEKLESAAQAVATDIYNKSLEFAEESDQFVSTSCDLFQDSASYDFLLARSNSNPSRDWRAESLYVKFDPLVSDVSMLPKGPTQPTSGEENGKNNVSPPTIGTPKHNPALAAIDRLLFYSPAMSTPRKVEEPLKMEDPVEEPPTESVPIVDAIMAKELELVRSTVLQLEEQLEKQAKEHEKELEKQKATFEEKIVQLQAQLSQEIKKQNQMTVVVDEYEKSISRLVAERERDRVNLEQEKTGLQEELQAANHHLSNTEAAFNDVHLKYERLKGVVAAYKSNEDVLKESIAENVETIKALENRYDQLKHHAMSQLEKANHELEGIRKQNEAETVKLQAMLRKADLKSNSLAEMVEQKVKENKELTQILDEVIARVGHPSD